jgi:predicted GNAT family acetyltransferase
MAASSPRFDIRDNRDRNRFEIDLGDGSIAFADYGLHPDHITFTHTEVPPSHGGQGLGTRLIRFALDSARKRGLKVVPACPFFADYIREHPEEQDLLEGRYRKKLGIDPA